MKKTNIGVDGVHEMIVQATTPITLGTWFEADEERSYVIKFSDYCQYAIQKKVKNKGNSSIFVSASNIITGLQGGVTSYDKIEVNKVVTECYSELLGVVGMLLIKAAVLYSGEDSSGWMPFTIDISLPVKLKDFLGESIFTSIEDSVNRTEFFKVMKLQDLTTLVDKCESTLLSMMAEREDFCFKDILNVNERCSNIAKLGIEYLILSKNKIKGRMVS